MTSPIPPLFTTTPLTISPSLTRSPTSLSFHMSTSTSDDQDQLVFPKLPIPTCPSTVNSTDSECFSDIETRIQSPSLLTYLFHSNSNSQSNSLSPITQPSSSSRSDSNDTNLSPTTKPILRRSAETSPGGTSLSDDYGLQTGLIYKPSFGFSQLSDNPHTSFNTLDHSIQLESVKPKRTCTLKFAVKSPPRDSISPTKLMRKTSSMGMARSPMPRWPARKEQESDEEGYQEDSEGGFTSDENDEKPKSLTTSKIWLKGKSLWPGHYIPSDSDVPNNITSKSPPRNILNSTLQRPGGSVGLKKSYSTADVFRNVTLETPSSNGRGRRVSIAAGQCKVSSKCSRHISPPPKLDSPLPSPSSYPEPEPTPVVLSENHSTRKPSKLGRAAHLTVNVVGLVPPAARSPSAFELCRRRDSGIGHISADEPCRTFALKSRTRSRSDSPVTPFPTLDIDDTSSITSNTFPSDNHKMSSLHVKGVSHSQIHHSILRRQSSSPHIPTSTISSFTLNTSTSEVEAGLRKGIEGAVVGRRKSAPVIRLKGEKGLWKLEPLSVIASTSNGSHGGAREVLQRALRSG
ncbi:hypothetical protein M231_06166 [Tremella mesenterica]|uniref:Uncharacterized protein n=1 Tax=Tremella mesenterica TaxID=5217 RepID=A0A4Q1BEA0_TREME|nr:hypothetical protein M231_06166 [Tremella mesenterica]